MKLSAWAKQQGVHYNTAYRWFREGRIPNATQFSTGTILVDVPKQNIIPETNHKEVHIYCRVSSNNKKDDLERQSERCKKFCAKNGYAIKGVIKEIASGMNDHRAKLIKLLSQSPKYIVVEHKDRFTRFGFNYFEVLLPMIGCQIIVINKDDEEQNDLMKDMISIITSFCCRLYGLRRGNQKSKKIQKELCEKSN